jgi:hypothetical protein
MFFIAIRDWLTLEKEQQYIYLSLLNSIIYYLRIEGFIIENPVHLLKHRM